MTDGRHRIGVIPGDGTGPEVVAEGLKVLDAVTGEADVELVEFDLGRIGTCGRATSCPTPSSNGSVVSTVSCWRRGRPPGQAGDPRTRPVAEGPLRARPVLNLRPVVLYPGSIPRAQPTEDDVNFIVVRENSEGSTRRGGFHRRAPLTRSRAGIDQYHVTAWSASCGTRSNWRCDPTAAAH